jgi:hypothetical protein
MKSFALTDDQIRALAALKDLAAHQGWKGEMQVVEGILIYQIPLPNDPDVSGAFFAVEPDEPNIRLYLTLPLNVPLSRIAEASEFAARSGYGRRFGALELSLDHGSLRVRMDTDVTDGAMAEAAARLVDRAMSLAHEVSPAWRAVCQGGEARHGPEGRVEPNV